jgi:hypothetical protein
MHARRVSEGPRKTANWRIAKPSNVTLASRFSVSVGSVVPHRDPEVGTSLPYIHARILPLHGDWRSASETRRFSGSTVPPPFVVVRRTSAPNQRRRLTATLILGTQTVAVENHLLVLRPLDGRVGTCRELLRLLRRTTSTEWINLRIRCRHLTVEALRELPWVES